MVNDDDKGGIIYSERKIMVYDNDKGCNKVGPERKMIIFIITWKSANGYEMVMIEAKITTKKRLPNIIMKKRERIKDSASRSISYYSTKQTLISTNTHKRRQRKKKKLTTNDLQRTRQKRTGGGHPSSFWPAYVRSTLRRCSIWEYEFSLLS